MALNILRKCRFDMNLTTLNGVCKVDFIEEEFKELHRT